jgi:beta-lactam-binding protein with PASTA domain
MARTPPPEPPDEAETVVRQDRWAEGPPVTERRVVEEEVAEPYEPAPPPDRHLWPWLLLLLALVLGGLALLWYLSQDDEETKPVPAVVRLTERDAVELLNEEGFDARVLRRPSQSPRGIVFAQDPGAGRELEEGRVVTISVSTGPESVDVPNVVGLPVEQAQERLREADLRARPVGVLSEEPRGTVVAQDPRAGEPAAPRSVVRINVSQGTGRVQVPDVVGSTASDARQRLSQAGLEGRIVQVPSAEPEGTVVAQSPTAGSEVARGSTVRLNVSDGSGGGQEAAEREVPNVEGLTEQDAIADLEDAGFTVRIRREEVTDPAEDGIVLRQDPDAGSTAREGDEVAIVVGQLAE